MFNSIQSGLQLVPATTDTLDITIPTPVTENKSFVKIEVANLSGESSQGTLAGDYLFAPELITVVGGKYTELRLRRWYLTSGGIQMYVKWTIFELINGSVEQGVTTMTSADLEVSVSNFVDGKTFSLAYLWADYNSWVGEFSSQIIKHKVYNNGSSDVIQLEGLNASSAVKVYWQSIYIPDATVNTYDFSVSSVQTFDKVITEVDPDKCILIGSIKQSSSPHDAWDLKGWRLLNSTEIRTYSQAAFDAEFVIYTIEHPAFNVKDRGFTSWSSQNVSFTLANPTNKDRSFVMLGGQNQHWGLVDFAAEWFGDIGHRSTLQTLVGDNYTQLRYDRGSTSGTDVITYFEVVELTLGNLGRVPGQKHFPAGFKKGQSVGFI